MTLLQRIEWILKNRADDNQRELARRAGLKNERHVGVILTRLRKNPESALDHDTLVKLARGGAVSVDWLATGAGPREASEASPGAQGGHSAREHAREVLEAAAGGKVADALIRALVDAVLDQEPVRLAIELRDDTSPQRVRRAIQLATAVLNPATDATPAVEVETKK